MPISWNGYGSYDPWKLSVNPSSYMSQEEMYRKAQEELLNNANQYPDTENITTPYDTEMASLTKQQLDAQNKLNQPESKTSKITNGIMGLLTTIAMIRDMTNKDRDVRARAPENVAMAMNTLRQAKEEKARKRLDEYTRTMQLIQSQKEDVQNKIKTAMDKAELKSANLARKANALNAIEKPVKTAPPSPEETRKAKLQAGYDALIESHKGATGQQLAKIAYEQYPQIYNEYFSKSYPVASPEESLEAGKEKYRKYFADFYKSEIDNGTPVGDAITKARAMVDALMAAEAGPGDYQPPSLNLTPPQFRNDFDIQNVPWLAIQKQRERQGGLSYDEYNKQFQHPTSALEKSSYYRY